jgi:hypothetical protein
VEAFVRAHMVGLLIEFAFDLRKVPFGRLLNFKIRPERHVQCFGGS